MAMNDEECATREFEAAVRLNPGFLKYRNILSRIYFRQDRMKGTIEMQDALQYGRKYFSFGRIDLEEAVRAYFNLVNAFISAGDRERARTVLDELSEALSHISADRFSGRPAIGEGIAGKPGIEAEIGRLRAEIQNLPGPPPDLK